MKLAVLDLKIDPVFRDADFLQLFDDLEITYIQISSNENFDGSLVAQVPANTTHLVMATPDRIGTDELRHLPSLKYIGLAFTGFWDKIFDQSLIKKEGIVVTNSPDYALAGVAEGVFAALLAHFRNLHVMDWKNPSSPAPIGRELAGKVLGIIGLGAIGKHVADIGSAFGMEVVSDSKSQHKNVKPVDRPDLLKTSDVITIHVPKSAGEILRVSDFEGLKQNVTLVNTSGKEKYNIDGLIKFLGTHQNSAYLFLALPEADHIEALDKLPNASLYPLFTSYTVEGESKRRQTTLENLAQYVKDAQPKNRVL